MKKIAKTVTCKDFHDFFSKFGNIISARLVEDEDGEVVGIGFVLYDKPESATLAIREGNNLELKEKREREHTFPMMDACKHKHTDISIVVDRTNSVKQTGK